ncbi:alpha/beta fold hydrolase [Paenibacillus nasutitermitis]|uniref:Alpha/beta hydrolase n=1 Tax=Paenibacillus nasutitermitis TaxID=1652958 RepID=A0A916Z4K5_9BACL|nr:alpha/beta hydrolase [Paenibacillus nasutitermitis]GGD75805.1 alpha/beta hydrolase [Paenibacillus nasutitermitis]
MTTLSLANRSADLPGELRLAYYDTGEAGTLLPADAAIVLLHGYCGSSAYWEPVLPKLAGLGRIIVPDLRGHGRSSAPAEDIYTMKAFAKDLHDLLQELGVNQICLFGHSLGGYISLAFAKDYPDMLLSFSLVHSSALADGEEARVNRDKAVNAIQTEGIRAFAEGLVPKLFAPGHREIMAESIEQMIEVGAAASAEGAAATAKGMKVREDNRHLLDRMKIPRLLIAGSEDGVIPVENTFTADGPNVSRVILQDTGHMGMIEQPVLMGDRISAFVRFIATL